MACGCGGKKVQYEVVRGDGTTTTVASLTEAMTMIRKLGGTYKAIRV